MAKRAPRSGADECWDWCADRSEQCCWRQSKSDSQCFYLSLAFKLSQMEATQEDKGQEGGWEREGEHGVGGESLTIPPSQQVGVSGMQQTGSKRCVKCKLMGGRQGTRAAILTLGQGNLLCNWCKCNPVCEQMVWRGKYTGYKHRLLSICSKPSQPSAGRWLKSKIVRKILCSAWLVKLDARDLVPKGSMAWCSSAEIQEPSQSVTVSKRWQTGGLFAILANSQFLYCYPKNFHSHCCFLS